MTIKISLAESNQAQSNQAQSNQTELNNTVTAFTPQNTALLRRPQFWWIISIAVLLLGLSIGLWSQTPDLFEHISAVFCPH
ncbi:hypothetical protein SAMN05421749_11037 [Acinetobacter marinus]|uniref:Uncharacterized protein n=1 Tax=Acinetobacter marinus TaxID=281375 RepID=A0A1G6NLL1_9GAMM|nr:hypothetical protein [Acinetobacter marinus]SDC68763.1 hypothetical protein SAMN05421749_11037 [Acinetobacter marinus]